jgi:hypothetical protein
MYQDANDNTHYQSDADSSLSFFPANINSNGVKMSNCLSIPKDPSFKLALISFLASPAGLYSIVVVYILLCIFGIYYFNMFVCSSVPKDSLFTLELIYFLITPTGICTILAYFILMFVFALYLVHLLAIFYG